MTVAASTASHATLPGPQSPGCAAINSGDWNVVGVANNITAVTTPGFVAGDKIVIDYTTHTGSGLFIVTGPHGGMGTATPLHVHCRRRRRGEPIAFV